MYTVYLGLYLFFSFTRNRLNTYDALKSMLGKPQKQLEAAPLLSRSLQSSHERPWAGPHNNQIPSLTLSSTSLSSQHLRLLPPLGLCYLHPHLHWQKMPGWPYMLTVGTVAPQTLQRGLLDGSIASLSGLLSIYPKYQTSYLP